MWSAPAEVKKVKKLPAGDSSTAAMPGVPEVIRKVIDYIMMSRHEGIEVEVSPYMASFLGEKRKKVKFDEGFMWDEGSLDKSWKLKGLLWAAAVIKANVSMGDLVKDLGKLNWYGRDKGGKAIPTSLPGEEELKNVQK